MARYWLLILIGLSLACGGCGGSNAPVSKPKVDPVAAAAAAIAQYDTDGDGVISSSEAKLSCLDAKFGWDSDGDGKSASKR